MTKTEYREYISSPQWKSRRSIFLTNNGCCFRCHLPRWMAIIAYDQDLHVHHISYAHIGHELDSELSPLCRRCHELETFGVTALHEVRSLPCIKCGNEAWDMISRRCEGCRAIFLEFVSDLVLETQQTLIEQYERRIERLQTSFQADLEAERNYELKRQIARDREAEEYPNG